MAAVRKILVLSMLFLLFLTAGCTTNSSNVPATGENTKQSQEQAASAGTAEQPFATGQESMQLKIYYSSSDAAHVVAEVRTVAKNDHPAQTAMELLLAGPQNSQLVSVLPKDTKLKNIWVKDHVAYVDFNDKLVKNSQGGSISEVLLTAALANTLTEFPDVKKVQILVEGQKISSLTGHMDMSEPFGRNEKIIKK